MTVLVLLLGAGMVSASEAGSDVQVVKDNQCLSTPDNYDVDNVVQSDRVLTKSEANVEKTSTKDDTNNNESSIDTFVDTDNTNEDLQTIASGSGHSAKVSVNEISGRTLNIACLENSGLLQETIDVNKISINGYDSLTGSEDMTPILPGETTDSSGGLVDTNTKSSVKSQETDKTIVKVQSDKSTKAADDESDERYQVVLSWNSGSWDQTSSRPYTYKNPWLMNDTTWVYGLAVYSASSSANPHGYYSASVSSRVPPGIYKRIELTDDYEIINTNTGENVIPYIRTFLYNHYNDTQNFTVNSNGKATISLVINSFMNNGYDYRIPTSSPNNQNIGSKKVWVFVNETLELVNNNQAVPNSGQFGDSDFLTYQFYVYEPDSEANGGRTYNKLIGFNVLNNINIEKQWEDTTAETRPNNVTVMINANGQNVKNVTLTAEDGWKTVATDLPVYEVSNAERVLEMGTDYTVETTTEDVVNLKIKFTPDSSFTGTTVNYNVYADGNLVWLYDSRPYSSLSRSSGFETTLYNLTKFNKTTGNPFVYTVKEANTTRPYNPLDDDHKHGEISFEVIDNQDYLKHFKVTVINEELIPITGTVPSGNMASLRVSDGNNYGNYVSKSFGPTGWDSGHVLNFNNQASSIGEDDLVVLYNYPVVNIINYTVDEVIYDYTNSIESEYVEANPLMQQGKWYIASDLNPLLNKVTITNTYFEPPIDIHTQYGLKYVIWPDTIISDENYSVIIDWGKNGYENYGMPWLMNDTTWVNCIEPGNVYPPDGYYAGVVPHYKRITLTDNEKIIHPLTGEDILPFLRTLIYYYTLYPEEYDIIISSSGTPSFDALIQSFVYGEEGNYRNPESTFNKRHYNGKTVWDYVKPIIDMVDAGNAISSSGVFNNSEFLTYQFYLYSDNQIYDFPAQNVIGFNVLTKIDVTKEWDDDNNLANQRPKSVQVQLNANGEALGNPVILNKSNNWNYTYTELPLYNIYNYTTPVSEDDYSIVIKEDNGCFAIKLTKNFGEWDETVEKPSRIYVTLYADGVEQVSTSLFEYSYSRTIYDYFPKYADDGHEIEYTVIETDEYAENGTISIDKVYLEEPMVSYNVTVSDELKDEDNIFLVLENGDILNEQILSEVNNWNVMIFNYPEDLDKYEYSVVQVMNPRINIINYTIDEIELPSDYTSTTENTTVSIHPLMTSKDENPEDFVKYLDEDINDLLTNVKITNVHEFTITKEWNDFDDKDGIRPDNVTVNIYANGEFLQEVVLNESNDWTISIKDLPKYDEDDNPIDYTVEEVTPEEYTSKMLVRGNYYKITNTHIPKYFTLNVTKIWNDGDNADNARPNNITVNLLANGEIYADLTLNASNNWIGNFTNLPEYINGVKVNYTINEVVPDGYKVEYGEVIPIKNKKDTYIQLDLLNLTDMDYNTTTENGTANAAFNIIVRDKYNIPVTVGNIDVTDGKGNVIYSGKLNDGSKFINVPVILSGQPMLWGKHPLIKYNLTINYYENDLYHNSSKNFLSINESVFRAVTEDRYFNLSYVDNTIINDTHANVTFKMVIKDPNRDYMTDARVVITNRDGRVVVYDDEVVNGTFNFTMTVKINEFLPEDPSEFNYSFSFDCKYSDEYMPVPIERTIARAFNEPYKPTTHNKELLADVYIGYRNNGDSGRMDAAYPYAPFNMGNEIYAFCLEPSVSASPKVIFYTPDYLWSRYIKIAINDETELFNDLYSRVDLTYDENALEYIKLFLYLHRLDSDNFNIFYGENQDDIQNMVHLLTGLFTFNGTDYEAAQAWIPNVETKLGKTYEYFINETKLLFSNGMAIDSHGIYNFTEDGHWEYQFYLYYPYNQLFSDNGLSLSPMFNTKTQKCIGIEYYFVPNENIVVTNLTNTILTSINVTKVWNDSDNQDGIRPDNITVALFKGDELYDKVILSEDNDWKHTFTDLPKYENGELIDYEVDEGVYEFILRGRDPNFRSEVPVGYTLEIDEVPEYNFTLTNTHVPLTTNITVVKNWTDDNDKVNIRPDHIVLQLYANGTPSGEPVVMYPDEDGNWKYDFTDLAVYSNGVKINYTVVEDVPRNYTETYNFTVNITVSHEYVAIKSRSSDEDTVTVYLLADGQEVDSVDIQDIFYSDWTHTFTDLPVYGENDEVISYSISWNYDDIGPVLYADYNMTYTYAVNIDNRITGITTINVTKVWNDTNNNDGKRPGSVNITLVIDGVPSDQTVELKDPKYEGGFSDLPMYHENGTAIVYNVTEVDSDVPEGYELSDIIFCEGRFKVINTHIPEVVEVPVYKVWDDSDNQDNMRPEQVTIKLISSDGKEYVAVITNDDILMENDGIDEDDSKWFYVFTDLPKYANGQELVYEVEETVVPAGYTVSIDPETLTITNSHELITKNISVVKVWNDTDNNDGKRPENVTIMLYADGVLNQTVVVKGSAWNYTFTDLTVYRTGKVGEEIVYTIVEQAVKDYETPVITSVGDNFTVTNTHVPEVVDVPVYKVWNDSDNQDNIRPEQVTIKLKSSDGKEYVAVMEEVDGEWVYVFTDLPKYANGQELVYEVEEVVVPNGYTVEYDEETLTITNTHEIITKNISVVKVWNDTDTAKDRPDSIKVILLADGKEYANLTLTGDEWADKFTNLPVYKEGEVGVEIVYSIKELTVANYTTVITNISDDFTITNTHIPELVDITINKVWNDNDNQDALRTNVTIILKADGVGVQNGTVQVNSTDDWTYTFTNLPKYANGKEIVYTIEEVVPYGYTVTIEGYTITNTHEVYTKEINVTKVWNDNKDNDNARMDVVVELLADGEKVDETTLNEGNSWKDTFKDLPVNKDGKSIVYTIKEVNVEHYITNITECNGNFIITNTLVPELVNVTVYKVWNDSNNQDGIRPEEVTLKLKADGQEYTVKVVKSTGGKWNYTFTDLPKYNAGKEIVYTVEEVNIANGYTVTYSEDTLSIVNTHIPETTNVNVVKDWDDNNNNDGKRPGSVTVELLADGVVVDTAVLDESNDWKYTFSALDKFANGKEIVYNITESNVPEGYTVKVVFCEGEFKVVNSYIPENTSISVSKVWEDNDNQDALRPDAVFVSVLANGEEYKLVKLTGENGWTVTVTGLPKYSNGKEIVYTVEEASVPDGYTAVVDGLTITNTHVPEVISVNVSKVWKDNDNNDGVRPESVTVNLLADGVKYASATLNEGNNWKFTFDNLPLNKEGRKVIYTVTEDSVEGYTTSLVNCNGTFKFINSHDDSKVNVTINKVWEDNNNQDAIRPNNVTVEVLANGERYDVVVINSTGDWKITVNDLPEFVGGQKVVYTVREIRVETGYTSSVDGFTITNTHEPFTKEINVTKIWNDNNSSLRPESVTVHLMDGDNVVATVSLSAGNDWKATFKDLPVNRDGKAIVYTVKEVEVPDYTTEIKDCCGNFKIVNTPVAVPINITVNKVWNDNNNNDGIRPGSVTIRLLADNEEVRVVTLTGDDWTYTFTNLPEYKDGKKVTYTVEEVEVPAGYTAVADGLTITNTHVDITKNITVSKFWDDDNNNDGKRPGSVTIRLLADGNEVATATLSDDNDWKHIFEDLPVNKDGKAIVYNVTEDSVDPYVVSITNVDDEFIVTNSYNITKINLTVNKVWVDDDNNDGLRPDNITVILYANGEELVAAVVGEDNDWTYTFSDLQKYNNGYLIEYTIDELPVDGYVASVDGLTITNTHDIITKDIPVSKVWVDNNNNDGTRPDSVTVNLYAFGRKVSSISITEADGWEGVFKDLPVYIKGNEIVYTIVEESVPDYWVTYNGSMIINTHDLVNTSVTVTKVWNDSDNNDGVRPDSVSVNLYADGVKVSSIVLSSNNSWTHTFDKLPKYDDGQIIVYTVDEEVVGAYSVSITEDSNYFIIVNNYETELINLTINKIWDDKDNYYGKRPVNVTVKVFADGEEIDSVVLSEENNWTCELNNLPKYDNGKLINYSVDEVNITYYHYSIEAKDNYTFTVINTLNKVRVFKWAWKLIGWNESYYERVEVDDNVPVVKRSSKVYAKGKGIGKYQPRYRAPYRNKNHISKGKHYINRLMFREHYRLFIYLYNQYLYGNMTYSEFVALLQLNGIQIDESNAWDSNGTLIFDYDDLEDVPDSIGLHDNGGHVKDSSDRVEKYKPISNSGVIDSGEVVAEVVDVEE